MSRTQAVSTAQPEPSVEFPEGQRPSESPIYTRNTLMIAAPAERVWAWLIVPKRWPEFYANATRIEVEGGDRLAPGTLFHWNTLGLRVHTTVQQFVPNQRLSWAGHGMGAAAYHGWVIEPRPGGCLVVTEETQQGFLASVSRLFVRRSLLKWHQRWLEGLAQVAAGGMP